MKEVLRTVVQAQGGFSELAERTNLKRQNLYRILYSNENPRLETLENILHGLGFRLSIEPLRKSA